MNTAKALNHHGTAIVIADHGVLITGPSGSGKTTLALALLAHCRSAGIFASLVSDDQVYLATAGSRLIAAVPEEIAGFAEAFGAGPAAIRYESRVVIDLMVELSEPRDVCRFRDDFEEALPGVHVRSLKLERRNAHAGVFAVTSLLGIAPFRNGKTSV